MHDSNYLNNHMKFGNKLMLPKYETSGHNMESWLLLRSESRLTACIAGLI